MLEELTWAETRDLIAAGTTTIIVGTGGTEQKGPHMVAANTTSSWRTRRDNCARARQDTRRPSGDLRARRQLGEPGRSYGQTGDDHPA